jgi:uncharacterized membrane protein YhdT
MEAIFSGRAYVKHTVKGVMQSFPKWCSFTVLFFLLIFIFLFSYKKQTDYITKRVSVAITSPK